MDSAFLESRPIMPRNLSILLAAVLIATLAFMLFYKYVYYPDLPDLAIAACAIAFILGIAASFLLYFKTEITEDSIVFTYMFRRTEVRKEEIIDTRTGELNIIKNYSNWTLKGVRYKTFSAIGEDLGVGLKITGKRVIFFSTKDPDTIASLLPKEEQEEEPRCRQASIG